MVARLLRDINPGSSGSFINNANSVEGALYFNATDGQNYGLWKTDGTSSGTIQLSAFETQPTRYDEYLAVDDQLFFTNFENETGKELWVSNGTKEGTKLIKDIFDDGSSNPKQLTKVNNEVYFLADSDGDESNELWVSDGTESGTQLVLESEVDNLTDVKGTLYYTEIESPGELWRIDNESQKAERILEDSGSNAVANLTRAGETLYFTRNSYELWKVENNSSEAEQIEEFEQTPNSGELANLIGVGSTLYFSFDDGEIGRELYKSSGEANNTKLLKDISPDLKDGGTTINLSSDLDLFTNIDGRLYFVADSNNNNSLELWTSIGTEESTKLVNEFGRDLINLTDVNGIVYFVVSSLSGSGEVWRSDGTEDGTTPATDVRAENFFRAKAANGDLYFPSAERFLDNRPGGEPWILDNTSEVTRLFDSNTKANVYTTDEDEIENLIDDGYEDRGIAFEGADPLSGQPVYTFVNEDNGARLYTIDEDERDEIDDTMSNFDEENETFFAYETRRTDTVPVYSFENIETGGEFLTTSLTSKESLDENDDFESNGVAFYAFPEIDFT